MPTGQSGDPLTHHYKDQQKLMLTRFCGDPNVGI